MIVRRRHVRANPRQVRWLCDGRQELRRPDVRPAKHPHLPIRVRQRRCPFHCVIPIPRFVLERVPVPLRRESPAHILSNRDVSARRRLKSKIRLTRLVIRRAHQQHGKLSVRFRSVNVRAKCYPVAHLRRYVALYNDFVILRRHHRWRHQHQCQHDRRKKKNRPFC